LNRYFKGLDDEDIISSIKQELYKRSDSCLIVMNEIVSSNHIDADIKRLENGNFQISYDMTEDHYRMRKLFLIPEMPLHLEIVKQYIL